ncbi:MAG: hypothetical protein R3E68_11975 [Burkholderiaceae bacterium]
MQMQTPDHSLPRLAQALQALDADGRSEFDGLVREHLGALMRYVAFEMENLHDAGLLDAQSLSIDEVIDKTLVRALQDLPYRMQVTPVPSWLTGLASVVMSNEVEAARGPKRRGSGLAALRKRRQTVRPSNPDNATLRDRKEESAGPDEIVAYLIELLADLPAAWRTAVIFFYMDERPESEIAQVLGLKDSSEVKEIVSHANAFLRARLSEDGLPAIASPGSTLRWPKMRDGLTDQLKADLSRAAG